MPHTTQEDFASASLVFVGEVVRREYRPDSDSFFGPEGTATLTVLRPLKGKPARTLVLELERYSALQGAEGDVAPSNRTKVLVFARPYNGLLYDLFCSGTGVIVREDERLHALGFRQKDFEALGLPTDKELVLRLTSYWDAWRIAVLACEDVDCYRRLRRDDRTDARTIDSHRKSFERERKFYQWLTTHPGYRLHRGAVGDGFVVHLEYRLASNNSSLHDFVVSFVPTKDSNDQWQFSGLRIDEFPYPWRDWYRIWIPDES